MDWLSFRLYEGFFCPKCLIDGCTEHHQRLDEITVEELSFLKLQYGSRAKTRILVTLCGISAVLSKVQPLQQSLRV